MNTVLNTLDSLRNNIKKVIVGKDDVIDLVFTALICEGNVLIEDVPGVGKTTLVSTLAASMGLQFRRIQFTPDILPSDITGFSMYNMKSGEFEYCEGMVMGNIILADELNRTSPKTQSSLLEAMEERKVTVDGAIHELPRPFMVLATQNSAEYIGTYPLPEAQLDRFLMRISMGYPSSKDELEILSRFTPGDPRGGVQSVCNPQEILDLQQQVFNVHCSEPVHTYIVQLVNATRRNGQLSLGVSPRGSIALMRAAQATALLHGREFVLPDDVQKMAPSVLTHRLIVRPEALLSGLTAERILRNILNTISVPVV